MRSRLWFEIAPELPQRRHVVEDPEAAAVRRDGEIVAVDDQIADRGVRQVQRQRLPVVAVVERDVDVALGAGKSSPRVFGSSRTTLTGAFVARPRGDRRPGRAAVVRAEDRAASDRRRGSATTET